MSAQELTHSDQLCEKLICDSYKGSKGKDCQVPPAAPLATLLEPEAEPPSSPSDDESGGEPLLPFRSLALPSWLYVRELVRLQQRGSRRVAPREGALAPPAAPRIPFVQPESEPSGNCHLALLVDSDDDEEEVDCEERPFASLALPESLTDSTRRSDTIAGPLAVSGSSSPKCLARDDCDDDDRDNCCHVSDAEVCTALSVGAALKYMALGVVLLF